MGVKVFIRIHGCQMNEYYLAKMLAVLKHVCNFDINEQEGEADVLLLNTCPIREKTYGKIFSKLGCWTKLKQENPQVIIWVGGCVASQEGEALRLRAPYVDMAFAPQALHRLPEPKSDGVKAFVSIMGGCSKHCSSDEVVLVDGLSRKNPEEITGRGENNQVVDFVAPESLTGDFVNVKLTEVLSNSLRGALL